MTTPLPPDDEPTLGNVIDVWKKVIDVQQHFNDIEMRIRNYALTLFAAVIGAAGLALQHGIAVRVPVIPTVVGLIAVGGFARAILPQKAGKPDRKERSARRRLVVRILWSGALLVVIFAAMAVLWRYKLIAYIVRVPLGAIILGAGLVAWCAFYMMDRAWYHRLLYGAVKHGQFLEDRLKERFPELGLTTAIGAASPIEFRGRKFGSSEKMDLFYLTVGALLAVLALSAAFVQPRQPSTTPTRVQVESLPTLPAINVQLNARPDERADSIPVVPPTPAEGGSPR